MAARLSIRIDLAGACRVGPGKMRLLQLIDETRSISAAGRAMAMSYRRAWLLVESLNSAFRAPVVAAQPGGRRGRGASLTPAGRALLERYRTIERTAAAAVGPHLAALGAGLKPVDEAGGTPRGAGERAGLQGDAVEGDGLDQRVDLAAGRGVEPRDGEVRAPSVTAVGS